MASADHVAILKAIWVAWNAAVEAAQKDDLRVNIGRWPWSDGVLLVVLPDGQYQQFNKDGTLRPNCPPGMDLSEWWRIQDAALQQSANAHNRT